MLIKRVWHSQITDVLDCTSPGTNSEGPNIVLMSWECLYVWLGFCKRVRRDTKVGEEIRLHQSRTNLIHAGDCFPGKPWAYVVPTVWKIDQWSVTFLMKAVCWTAFPLLDRLNLTVYIFTHLITFSCIASVSHSVGSKLQELCRGQRLTVHCPSSLLPR